MRTDDQFAPDTGIDTLARTLGDARLGTQEKNLGGRVVAHMRTIGRHDVRAWQPVMHRSPQPFQCQAHIVTVCGDEIRLTVSPQEVGIALEVEQVVGIHREDHSAGYSELAKQVVQGQVVHPHIEKTLARPTNLTFSHVHPGLLRRSGVCRITINNHFLAFLSAIPPHRRPLQPVPH